jgi:hypothetical protein
MYRKDQPRDTAFRFYKSREIDHALLPVISINGRPSPNARLLFHLRRRSPLKAPNATILSLHSCPSWKTRVFERRRQVAQPGLTRLALFAGFLGATHKVIPHRAQSMGSVDLLKLEPRLFVAAPGGVACGLRQDLDSRRFFQKHGVKGCLLD